MRQPLERETATNQGMPWYERSSTRPGTRSVIHRCAGANGDRTDRSKLVSTVFERGLTGAKRSSVSASNHDHSTTVLFLAISQEVVFLTSRDDGSRRLIRGKPTRRARGGTRSSRACHWDLADDNVSISRRLQNESRWSRSDFGKTLPPRTTELRVESQRYCV